MHKFIYWLISSNSLFCCRILGLKFFYTLSFQKCTIALYLSVLVSKFLMHMLMFCLLLCSLVLILFYLIRFNFFKTFCSIKYVLLAFRSLAKRFECQVYFLRYCCSRVVMYCELMSTGDFFISRAHG